MAAAKQRAKRKAAQATERYLAPGGPATQRAAKSAKWSGLARRGHV
ncbi:MAG TPA: hypothetical protein VIK45_22715 [Candidatus Dormibacteraeota bacterium]